MTRISEKVKRDRLNFIRHILSRIRNIPDYSNFYSNAFCVIADLGLQQKAKEEGFFTVEWYNSKNQNKLQKDLEVFLFKHIK
ncbi:hypothetical protein ES703_64736 [subsurface metagenome]